MNSVWELMNHEVDHPGQEFIGSSSAEVEEEVEEQNKRGMVKRGRAKEEKKE